MGEYTTFSKQLTIMVSQELRALLKIAPKTHPELHVQLVDLLKYMPKFLVGLSAECPTKLGMMVAEVEEWEIRELLDDMIIVESALQNSIGILPNARFPSRKAVYV